MTSKSSLEYPAAICLFRNSRPVKQLNSLPFVTFSKSIILLAHSSNGNESDSSFFKSLSCNKIPLVRSTAIISPGPKAPFSTT